MTIFLLAALFLATFTVTLADLSCVNRDGNPVPWYTFIKFPENITYSGARYGYLDPTVGSKYKVIYGYHVDSEYEALANTIYAINGIEDQYANVLVFNDEPPNDPWNPEGGHAKGIIAYDNETKTGVYIMHSFPKFPNVSSDGLTINYSLPHNTYEYAQNAYCITLDETILSNLIENLPIEQPNVYLARGFFSSMIFANSTDHQVATFNLTNGDAQWYFTKNPNFNGFLYEDIIGPYFNSSLAVESWGRPYQDPVCPHNSTYATVNIDKIAFNVLDTWDHYSDHSKWAITVGDGNPQVACLCDMNRMDTQEIRGGSCLCTKNSVIYSALSTITTLTDKCTQKIVA